MIRRVTIGVLAVVAGVLLGACSLFGRADVRIAQVPASLQWDTAEPAPSLDLSLIVKGPAPESKVTGYKISVYDEQNNKVASRLLTSSIATLPRVPDAKDLDVEISLPLDLGDFSLSPGKYMLEISLRVQSPAGSYYLDPFKVQLVVTASTAVPSPTVEFVNVKDGQSLSGQVQVRIQVHTSPGTEVDEVKLFLRSQLVGEKKNEASAVFAVDTTQFINGDAKLRVEATAKRDSRVSSPGTAEINVVLSNKIPPTLTIAEPSDGAKVGGTLPVVVAVQKQTTNFSYQAPIEVDLFDYDNHLVDSREITAPDNQDFIGRIDPVFDISNSYMPNDRYYIEARTVVRLDGESEDRTIVDRIQVSTLSESNLPPALRIDFPFRLMNYDVSANPAAGVPVVGDVFGILGLVTDDSGSVESIEARLVCDGSIPSAEDDSCKAHPINALLPYLSQPYGYFDAQQLTNSTPYIPDGLYILKVVAIDANDTNLRNTQEIVLRVDRSATAAAARQPLVSNPITLTDSQAPSDDHLIVAPGTADWTIDLSSSTHDVRVNIALIKVEDVQRPVEVVTATLPAGGAYTYRRSFGKNDEGSYTIRVAMTDLVTGATVFRTDAPTLKVEAP